MRPSLLFVLACVVAAPSAAGQEVIAYDNPEERAAGWALLRRPLVFESGSAVLTPTSLADLADQALTLAQNPELNVAITVEGSAATASAADALVDARAQAIEAVLASAGVADEQVRFVPAMERLGQDGGVLPADAEETAAIISPEGGLTAGAAQAPITVRSWGGAKVYVIGRLLYDDDARVVCTPPSRTLVGFVPAGGTFTKHYSLRSVVLVAHHRTAVAVAFHNVGDETPVDLTTALDVCE